MKNSFTKKSVGTMTLGEKLRKIRSNCRININEVSKNTRIPIKYLEYLEDGNYIKLPADVYVKGFLKKYAEFFGADERIFIKLYEKERDIKKNIENKENEGKKEKLEPINISSFIITPKVFLTGLILFIFLGVFFYLYKEVGSFSNAPRLVILSPDKNYSTSGTSVVIEGVTDKDAKIFVNDQSILVNDEGKFRENITVQSGLNIVNIKSVNRFDRETVETLSIQSSYKQEATNDDNSQDRDKIEASEKKGVEIELRVDPGPVWLSVESDGNLVFSGTMLTGAIQIFKAEQKIIINSGKGNATFLKFNGKDIGVLSDDPGAVRGVTFNTDTKY